MDLSKDNLALLHKEKTIKTREVYDKAIKLYGTPEYDKMGGEEGFLFLFETNVRHNIIIKEEDLEAIKPLIKLELNGTILHMSTNSRLAIFKDYKEKGRVPSDGKYNNCNIQKLTVDEEFKITFEEIALTYTVEEIKRNLTDDDIREMAGYRLKDDITEYLSTEFDFYPTIECRTLQMLMEGTIDRDQFVELCKPCEI